MIVREQQKAYHCLKINGTRVERLDGFRYLGVHFTEDLNWAKDSHCLTAIISEASGEKNASTRPPLKMFRLFQWLGVRRDDFKALQRVLRSAEWPTRSYLQHRTMGSRSALRETLLIQVQRDRAEASTHKPICMLNEHRVWGHMMSVCIVYISLVLFVVAEPNWAPFT